MNVTLVATASANSDTIMQLKVAPIVLWQAQVAQVHVMKIAVLNQQQPMLYTRMRGLKRVPCAEVRLIGMVTELLSAHIYCMGITTYSAVFERATRTSEQIGDPARSGLRPYEHQRGAN